MFSWTNSVTLERVFTKQENTSKNKAFESDCVIHTLLLLGFMQRTKKGFDVERVDIRECNEFWVKQKKGFVCEVVWSCTKLLKKMWERSFDGNV